MTDVSLNAVGERPAERAIIRSDDRFEFHGKTCVFAGRGQILYLEARLRAECSALSFRDGAVFETLVSDWGEDKLDMEAS